MKRTRESHVLFSPWLDLIQDMQQLIFREFLDPWTQQHLAVTCQNHFARWYDLTAATGEWMGQHCPTWQKYMDHSLTKTEGILRGIIQARRFSILLEIKNDIFSSILAQHTFPLSFHQRAQLMYESTLPFGKKRTSSVPRVALNAKGERWPKYHTYWVLYDEAITAAYTVNEVLQLQAILPVPGKEEPYKQIFLRFCQSGQFQLVAALEGATHCQEWHQEAYLLIAEARHPMDWAWVRSQDVTLLGQFDEMLCYVVHQTMSAAGARSERIVRNILQTVGHIRQPARASMGYTFLQWAQHTTLNLAKCLAFIHSFDTEYIY
jgi:hypothetical protein